METQRLSITGQQWLDASRIWDYHQMHHQMRPCDVAIGLGSHDLGVPDRAILLEPNATNTGQNISLSREVLAAAHLEARSLMFIAMPYMERRAFATCRKVWPEVEVVCASAPLEFNDYVKVIGSEKHVIDMLVGDLQRVIEYPKLGFAIEQEVPEEVLTAYDRLLRDGFDSRVLKS
jgi:uncharacterized SAM-binding protein YcdF (DUF218 family)